MITQPTSVTTAYSDPTTTGGAATDWAMGLEKDKFPVAKDPAPMTAVTTPTKTVTANDKKCEYGGTGVQTGVTVDNGFMIAFMSFVEKPGWTAQNCYDQCEKNVKKETHGACCLFKKFTSASDATKDQAQCQLIHTAKDVTITMVDNTADDKKADSSMPNDAVGEFGGWSFGQPAAAPADEKKEEEGANHLAAGLTATAMAALMMN